MFIYCFDPFETVSKGHTLYHARQALVLKDLRHNCIGNGIYYIQPEKKYIRYYISFARNSCICNRVTAEFLTYPESNH